jgi:hypothetical protein
MIKKISILTAIALLVSSAAFAANITMTLAAGNTGKSVYGAKAGTATAASPLIGKTSTGCGIGVLTAAAGYAIVTQHLNGTKAYGTTFDSTAMLSSDVTTKGTPLLGIPGGSDVATAFSGGTWTSM